MKKIILVLIFNFFFLTVSYSQKINISDFKEVNVSCSGTAEGRARYSFNWLDDYTFTFSPKYSLDFKTILGYKITRVSLVNCTHCMGRDEVIYDIPINSITITNSSITFISKGKTETNTTISRSSGNFSSIDKINSENIVSRQGYCKNIDLLFAKINEYENFKPIKSNKSIGSPNKETDTGAKDLLKKIIGK